MKIAEADLIIVPGYTNAGPDHWQTRWETKFNSAWRIEQDDWHKPVVEEWFCADFTERLMNQSY